jgi:hypothetical protein
MFELGSSLRFYSSLPFHPFASVVEVWIASEVSLYGVRPTVRLGAWLSLLLQNGKDSCRCLVERARSKQPKAPNSVLIVFRNVLRPAVNEFFQRALHINPRQQQTCKRWLEKQRCRNCGGKYGDERSDGAMETPCEASQPTQELDSATGLRHRPRTIV